MKCCRNAYQFFNSGDGVVGYECHTHKVIGIMRIGKGDRHTHDPYHCCGKKVIVTECDGIFFRGICRVCGDDYISDCVDIIDTHRTFFPEDNVHF